MMTWWWQFVAFCLSLTTVAVLIGLLGKWVRRMWGTNRKFNRFLDQMLGDANAIPPIPSLMDKLTAVQNEQARQAAWQAEHSILHGIPLPPASNGGASEGVSAPRHRRISP